MFHAAPPPSALRNRILSALPAEEYARIAPHLEYVELRVGEVLYRPTDPIRHVHFPSNGTISLTCVMADGGETEVGMIGREGMFGLPLVLGADSVPLKAIMQTAGTSARMRTDLFKDEVTRCEVLQRQLLMYAQAFFVQTAQTAACNRLHKLDARLCRWLLTARDRAHTDELPLTHDFLSVMLGVRRAGVTETVGALQRAGLVGHERGKVRILDAAGLEDAACECYRMVRDEYDRLLGE